MKKAIPYFISMLLFVFGMLTLILSASIVFDWFGIREKEGDYVLIVVWANLICSFLYIISAIGVITLRPWAPKLLILSVFILSLAFIGFIIHINSGGLYETKTIGALIFRIVVSLALAFASMRLINKKNTSVNP